MHPANASAGRRIYSSALAQRTRQSGLSVGSTSRKGYAGCRQRATRNRGNSPEDGGPTFSKASRSTRSPGIVEASNQKILPLHGGCGCCGSRHAGSTPWDVQRANEQKMREKKWDKACERLHPHPNECKFISVNLGVHDSQKKNVSE